MAGLKGKEESKLDKKIIEELSKEILSYYKNFSDSYLRDIAKTCAKIIISNNYHRLCFDNFQIPSEEDIKDLVLEEIRRNFNERIITAIESTYPNLTDEEVNFYILKAVKSYEKEHKEQLDSGIRAVLKELKIRVKELQKELKILKRKYTI